MHETRGSIFTVRIVVRLMVAGLSLTVVSRLFGVAWNQLGFPFDLGFEAPNLSTIQLFKERINPYSEGTYAGFPFALTMYTPLYHLLVASLPASGGNPFFVGRLVALISMIAASGALFAVPNLRRRWVLPLLGVAVFYCFPAVISNSAYIKNDMLALCLSAWAVVAVSRTGASRYAHLVAALLAILAIAAKQSYGAAFLACGSYLLLQHRSKAIGFGLVWFCSLLMLCAIAQIVWGDGFWFSTIIAPANPMDWGQTQRLVTSFLLRPVFGVLMMITLAFTVAGFRGKETTHPATSPFFLYAIFSGLLLLLTVGKVGASTNYFFEFILAQAMWLVDAKRGGIDDWLKRPLSFTALAILSVCIVINLAVTNPMEISFLRVSKEFRAKGVLQWQETLRREGIHEPIVLNLGGQAFTYDMQDRAVLNDKILYQVLWNSGVLENTPMLKAIREHAFDVVVTPRKLRESLSLDPPFRQIQEQVLKSYQYWRRGWYGEYYRPR